MSLLLPTVIIIGHLQSVYGGVAYSYLYVKSKNGALCFDSNESSMKVTATGCCLPKKVTLSSSGVINVGESHCYGKGDSSGLKNGDSLKVLKKGILACSYFDITENGALQLTASAGLLCLGEISSSPKLRTCGSMDYIIYNNGTCPSSKESSTLIKSVTKLTTMNNYYLRDDGSKLLLEKSPETRSKPSTHLKVYSNSQLWVIGKNNKEQCLHVDHKEHLNSLDGIDVKLADKEEDCKGHRFVFRDKINTYEFYGTNYCWKNEGGSLKLRRCNTIIGSVFIEDLKTTSTADNQPSTGQASQIQFSSIVLTAPSSSLKSFSTRALPTPAISTSANSRYHSFSKSLTSLKITQRSQTIGTYQQASSVSQLSVESTPLYTRKTSSIQSGRFSPSSKYSYNSTGTLKETVLSGNVFSGDATPLASTFRTQKLTESALHGSRSDSVLTTFRSFKTDGLLITITASHMTRPESKTSSSNQEEIINHELYVADPGQQCGDFCQSKGLYCSNQINAGNSNRPFKDNGLYCNSEGSKPMWTNAYDPSYDLKSKTCNGYIYVNESIQCFVDSYQNHSIRRLCKCLKSADEESYSSWGIWSDCTKTCNNGTRTRTRFCLRDSCNRNAVETGNCNMRLCPVSGDFSEWTRWSSCSQPCGSGTQNRKRLCNNPYPQHGGLDCYGKRTMKQICNVHYCPVDGSWTQWTQWSACDKPCNKGWYKRWRFCTNPLPLFGGENCQGDPYEKIQCNIHACQASNFTAFDVKLDKKWNPMLSNTTSKEYRDFKKLFDINLNLVFNEGPFKVSSTILELREGSIVMSVTLHFVGIDSFQMLLIQDAIHDDKYIGKLKIISSNTTFASITVPSSHPTNLKTKPLSPTSIKAEWSKVESKNSSENISGYILFYREKLLRSEAYRSLATFNNSVIIRGLKAYTIYSLRVLAYNDKGNGLASSSTTVHTRESVPGIPPQSITATSNSPFSVILSWDNLHQSQWNGKPIGYQIQYDDLNGHLGNTTVLFPQVSYIQTDLTPLTSYVFDVAAYTSEGLGPSQRVHATTLPSSPSKSPQLTIQSLISHNSFVASWLPVDTRYTHGDLKGYKIIYYQTKRAGKPVIGAKRQTLAIHPSMTNVTLAELQPNSEYVVHVLAFNEIGDGVLSRTTFGETCACPETIYSNFAASAPYVYRDNKGLMKGLLIDVLNDMMSSVCGNCKRSRPTAINFLTNGKNSWAEKRSLKDMKTDMDDFVHISFPIFGNSEMMAYNGFQFVPLFNHPGVIYYIVKDTLKTKVIGMIRNVLDTWPMLVINALLILLSGYIVWALDNHSNQSDFPRTVFHGVGSGVYWAFITMGTHGYGDLTPKGIAARLHAIVWILVGIVNFGILTGALTTALTSATVYDDTRIYGVQVAAVHHSEAYRIGILRNAKINSKQKYKTIEEVAKALKNREVRGALVDLYTAASRSDLLYHSDIVAKNRIRYANSYGLVASGDMSNAAPACRSYMKENAGKFLQEIIKKSENLEIDKTVTKSVPMFTPESELLQTTLISLAAAFVAMLMIGFFLHFCILVKKSSLSATQPFGILSEIEATCNANIESMTKSIEENVGNLMEEHLKERIRHMARRK